MRTIAIANRRGGCGKTTTAVNLAACLAELGARVLVVDADPKAHATRCLGVDPDDVHPNLYEVLAEADGRSAVARSVVAISDRLAIVPSSSVLAAIEHKLASPDRVRHTERLSVALAHLAPGYDCAIVDCPPAFDFLTSSALRAAQEILVPVETSALSVGEATALLEAIELLDQRLETHHAVHVLPTRFDGRTAFGRRVLAEIRARFAADCLDTVIRSNVRLQEAMQRGIPAIVHAPRAYGSIDHLTLAAEVESRMLRGGADGLHASTRATSDHSILPAAHPEAGDRAGPQSGAEPPPRIGARSDRGTAFGTYFPTDSGK